MQLSFMKDSVPCLSISGRHTHSGAVEVRHLGYFVAVAKDITVLHGALKPDAAGSEPADS